MKYLIVILLGISGLVYGESRKGDIKKGQSYGTVGMQQLFNMPTFGLGYRYRIKDHAIDGSLSVSGCIKGQADVFDVFMKVKHLKYLGRNYVTSGVKAGIMKYEFNDNHELSNSYTSHMGYITSEIGIGHEYTTMFHEFNLNMLYVTTTGKCIISPNVQYNYGIKF